MDTGQPLSIVWELSRLANPLHIIYMLEVEEQEGKIKRLWNELPKIKITEKVLSED